MIKGERLRELREYSQMSAEQAARQLKMGRAQLMRYENEKSDATTEVLIRIATFYGVSTDYLLGLTDESAPIGMRDLSQEESTLILWWRKREFVQVMRVLFQSLIDPEFTGNFDRALYRDIEFEASRKE